MVLRIRKESSVAEFDANRLRTQLLVQRQRLLLAIGLGIFTVLLIAFGLWPLWERLRVVQSDLRRQRDSLQKISQRAALVTSIDEADRQNFRVVARALPLQKQPLVVLQSLEAIAGATDVSLGTFDLSPGVISTESAETTTQARRRSRQATTRVQNLTLSVEVTGSFEGLLRSLEEIERTSPLMEVMEMGVDPAERGTFDEPVTEYTATLRIVAYFLPFSAQDLSRTGGAAALTRTQEETLQQVNLLQYRLSETAESTVPDEFVNTDLFGVQSEPIQSPTPTPEPTGEEVPAV